MNTTTKSPLTSGEALKIARDALIKLRSDPDAKLCHFHYADIATALAATEAASTPSGELPALPPLPEPWIRNLDAPAGSQDHFAADQVRDYALAFGLKCEIEAMNRRIDGDLLAALAQRASAPDEQVVTRLDVMSLIRSQMHRVYAAAICHTAVNTKYITEIEDAIMGIYQGRYIAGYDLRKSEEGARPAPVAASPTTEQARRTGYGEGVRKAAQMVEDDGAMALAEKVRNLQSSALPLAASTAEPVVSIDTPEFRERLRGLGAVFSIHGDSYKRLVGYVNRTRQAAPICPECQAREEANRTSANCVRVATDPAGEEAGYSHCHHGASCACFASSGHENKDCRYYKDAVAQPPLRLTLPDHERAADGYMHPTAHECISKDPLAYVDAIKLYRAGDA